MSQKKAKFNIVDIIVILILIAGIAFVGMRMMGRQEAVEAETYLLTFRSDCVPEELAATLSTDSAAKDNGRNIALGTLVEVTTGESVTYGYDSKGNCVASQKPGYVSVTLVCRVTGTQEPTGLQVGQFMLNIGHDMGVRCGNTEINTTVWSIAPAATE